MAVGEGVMIMKRKIILALLISTLLALSVVFMAGCGEVRLDSPKNLDILTESTGFVFKWDAVDGADGYLLYFNDDLSNRFYLVENKLPMNDSEIANYLKSGIANSVNIRAVKLDRNNFPVNQSAKSVILFNYSKKLNAPQRVSSVDGIVSFKTVSEAKNYIIYIISYYLVNVNIVISDIKKFSHNDNFL